MTSTPFVPSILGTFQKVISTPQDAKGVDYDDDNPFPVGPQKTEGGRRRLDTADVDTQLLLTRLLDEIKKSNFYLSQIADIKVKTRDVLEED